MRPTLTLLAAFAILTTAASARAGTIDLIVNAYATYNDTVTPIPTKCGDPNLTPVEPGSIITYEVAVAVDPAAAHPQGNMGLAAIVFSVLKCDPDSTYHIMNPMTAAETGYAQSGPTGIGELRYFYSGMYVDTGTDTFAGYDGGWGFDNSSLPIGGNTTSEPGNILGAGQLAPLTWTADVNTHYPGLQPYVRQGIGHGLYVFPDDDPACGGLQGGFGQDITDVDNIIEGDGHWLMWRSWIDTSTWGQETWGADYGWNVVPTIGHVYSPTVDYNFDVGGGFRINVLTQDMTADSFAFTLIPEPTTLTAVLLAALALARPRR